MRGVKHTPPRQVSYTQPRDPSPYPQLSARHHIFRSSTRVKRLLFLLYEPEGPSLANFMTMSAIFETLSETSNFFLGVYKFQSTRRATWQRERALDRTLSSIRLWVVLPKAYVEVRTLAGWQGSLVRDLEKMKSSGKESPIRDYDVIFGDYDLMVVIEHTDRRTFHKAIGDLSRLSGVESVNSRVVMDKDDVEESLGPSRLKPSKLSGAP